MLQLYIFPDRSDYSTFCRIVNVFAHKGYRKSCQRLRPRTSTHPVSLRSLPRPTIVIPHQFRCSCHSEPVLTLARQSVSPSLRTAPLLSFRASPQTGVGIRVPHPRAAGPAPLFAFASGGHLSFNSERKVRKNATKTYGFGFPQRAAPCHKFASCFSRNRLSRVPLSVKRTVPPQLSATASLPLPVATVAVSTSTAVTGRDL